jgi:hypothetical protein
MRTGRLLTTKGSWQRDKGKPYNLRAFSYIFIYSLSVYVFLAIKTRQKRKTKGSIRMSCQMYSVLER